MAAADTTEPRPRVEVGGDAEATWSELGAAASAAERSYRMPDKKRVADLDADCNLIGDKTAKRRLPDPMVVVVAEDPRCSDSTCWPYTRAVVGPPGHFGSVGRRMKAREEERPWSWPLDACLRWSEEEGVA